MLIESTARQNQQEVERFLTEHRESLFSFIISALRNGSGGELREYDLLRLLEDEGIPCFLTGHHDNPLILFRSHFLLFHLLYELRDRLREEGDSDLEIHCLRIALVPPKSLSESLPDHFDSLREYYRDRKNLWETNRDDVLDMMAKFWRLYDAFVNRHEALQIFGLESGASPESIKRRFRELARATHPDRGGKAEDFRRVMQAAASLLQ